MNLQRNAFTLVQVEPGVLEKWRLQCRHGDKEQMAKVFEVSRSTIINAFRGSAQPELITAITKYLTKRKLKTVKS